MTGSDRAIERDPSEDSTNDDATVSRLRAIAKRRPAETGDRRWLAVPLLAGTILYLTYLSTHEYPAYGAGLYLQIVEQIRADGYALPTTIAGYTRGGVPFAYPPFAYYLGALVRDGTGVSPLAYARYVPGLLVLLYQIPYYFTARELLGSDRRAALATTLFAVTPAALQWHLSAGGIVRSVAFLFTLVGAYVGIRTFRDRALRWLPVAAVLFGLTVLTHPIYTVFFGLTYLLLFARFDPTARGLGTGIAVAVGGVVLASPWLGTVVQRHGIGVFTAVADTHSGLGGGATRLLTEFIYPLSPSLEMLFFLGAYLGALYALRHGRWFLPAWLLIPGFLIGKTRFQFVAGSMLTVLFITEWLLPRITRRTKTPSRRQSVKAIAAVVLVVGAVSIGTAFAAGAVDHHGGSTQPAFMDDEDREAMQWAAANTDAAAQFVVLGDAAEWFPLFTDRTILVGPWGVEWTSGEQYRFQLRYYRSISACPDEACLSGHLQSAGFAPEYVYVPKGHYTVRGAERTRSDRMRSSMVASERYELAYENDGVMLFRVRSTPTGS